MHQRLSVYRSMDSLRKLILCSLAIIVFGQETTPSGPTQPKTVPNCQKWYTVKSGDSCFSVETAFSITHAQFVTLNPDVSNDCLTNFWLGYSYCVEASSLTKPTPTITGSPSSIEKSSSSISSGAPESISEAQSSISTTYSIRNPITTWKLSTPTVDNTWPPKKTQTGQPSYCNKWYLVKGDDTCETVYRRFATSMSRDDLYVVEATLRRGDWNNTRNADPSLSQ